MEKNRGQKFCIIIPLKFSQKQKTPGGKNFFL
jgi:hypothetical protein